MVPSTMAPSSMVAPKVWAAVDLRLAAFRGGAFASIQFQKPSLSFQGEGRSSRAVSGKCTVMNSSGSPTVFSICGKVGLSDRLSPSFSGGERGAYGTVAPGSPSRRCFSSLRAVRKNANYKSLRLDDVEAQLRDHHSCANSLKYSNFGFLVALCLNFDQFPVGHHHASCPAFNIRPMMFRAPRAKMPSGEPTRAIGWATPKSRTSNSGRSDRSPRRLRTTAICVRREKAALSSG